ncbi:glycosyltransferase [Coraliomargarita sinensis]|uniref:glycosyltransferase n=1 Tax=Coraliomargarita sinensis TaxID=2174842 RepID=UPI001E6389B3|nr:glycosyltransferase [Coraliomargarita sinensis]
MSANATAPAPLRVAFFSDSLSERNGTGAYYHDLLAQLGPLVEAAEVFQPLDMKRPPLLSWPMPGDPSQRLVTPNLPRISRAYRKLQPNIVVSITPGPFGMLGLYHAKRNKAAFISAFHTDFEQLARIYWRPLSRWFVNGYLNNANRFLCKRSAAVLVNNSNLQDDVEALGAPAVEIMGTPIQPMFLEKAPSPYPETLKRICFAGRLAPEKNVDRIIDAAAQLPHIEFLIGGDGPLRKELESSAAKLNNVTFCGWMNREDLIGLIDQSSLLLLPSKIETFGSVALEAMARGRPALVSSNAGIHDWPQLKDGLFAYDQERPLIDAIRDILALPESQLKEKADAARAAAEGLNHQTIRQWVDVLGKYAKD